tara:strand:+ start:135 stop:389 length:255 start_codon:yes stop_codon:yes gene_type:complete
MATVTMTIEEYEALMDLVRSAGGSTSLMTSAPADVPEPKPKRRKKSKYSRELGRQLKMLKKKHPRTAITKLMKRAHRATKKALK